MPSANPSALDERKPPAQVTFTPTTNLHPLTPDTPVLAMLEHHPAYDADTVSFHDEGNDASLSSHSNGTEDTVAGSNSKIAQSYPSSSCCSEPSLLCQEEDVNHFNMTNPSRVAPFKLNHRAHPSKKDSLVFVAGQLSDEFSVLCNVPQSRGTMVLSWTTCDTIFWSSTVCATSSCGTHNTCLVIFFTVNGH